MIKAIIEGTINKALNINEEILQVRRQICMRCVMYDTTKDKCTSCGCPISKKGRVQTERCPLKKW